MYSKLRSTRWWGNQVPVTTLGSKMLRGSYPSMYDCFAGSGWDRTTTSMENKVLLLQWLCRDRRNWGLWPGEASGGRQALPRLCDTSSLSEEAAYFFFLGDKLCCFGLPQFAVSLVTSWYGVGDIGWWGAQKRQEPVAKIVTNADDIGRLFVPRKKKKKQTKRQNGCLLAKTVAVFCALWCFIILKGKKTMQQN